MAIHLTRSHRRPASVVPALLAAALVFGAGRPAAAQGPVFPGPDTAPLPIPTEQTFDPTFGLPVAMPAPDPATGSLPSAFDPLTGQPSASTFDARGGFVEPTPAEMRNRVNAATTLPPRDPNASNVFAGQVSSQNSAVEIDRRSRLIDELSSRASRRELPPRASGADMMPMDPVPAADAPVYDPMAPVAGSPVRMVISITDQALASVVARHVAGGSETAGESVFSGGVDEVRALVGAAEGTAATLQLDGNLRWVVNAGRVVGIDRATGGPTSIYTVIANAAGDLVTAFPGLP